MLWGATSTRTPLRGVAHGALREWHQYCSPAELAVQYRLLAARVREDGVPVQCYPFPADLRDELTTLCDAPASPGRCEEHAAATGRRHD